MSDKHMLNMLSSDNKDIIIIIIIILALVGLCIENSSLCST